MLVNILLFSEVCSFGGPSAQNNSHEHSRPRMSVMVTCTMSTMDR